MDPDNAQGDGQVVTITLPRNLVQRLARHIHPDNQNRFIADAIEQRLSFEEQFTALVETAADWMQGTEADSSLPEDEVISWLRESEGIWNQAHH